MRKLIISIALLAAGYAATAQEGYEPVLQQIEQNSTTLNVLREQMQAQKLGNRTGINPANPEVEFNYLWGSPSAIGNRTDIKVTQTIDFPSAYVQRSRIANMQNRGAELAYKSERIDLLLAAKQSLIELTYYNALAQEYEMRLSNSQQIAQTYAARMERGDANAIENNKAQLNLRTVQNELARIDIERGALLSELTRMNGGQPVVFDAVSFPAYSIPADFASWYTGAEAKSPALQYLSTQVDISQQQVKLSRSMALPKITAGYMSEKVVGQRYQGITTGISIPLWENKNRAKQARAEVRAAETVVEDTRLQFYGRLQNLYSRASDLQHNAQSYRASLSEHNNAALLGKAFEAGEISLLEYLLEAEYYYRAVTDVLEAERDYQLAVAELSAVEL